MLGPVGSEDDERHYTTGDVGRVTGLSYRQLNDWESRGALPGDEGREKSWRRFTTREVFVLLVLAELRKGFGVSVERLGFVQDFMLQKDANHLHAAAELMVDLGVEVWLMTDFETTFVMDTELEFADMWQHGYFGGPLNTFAFLKVSPLVNRILSLLKQPVLPSHGRGYQIIAELHARFGARTPTEFRLLETIRTGKYDSIEVVMKDGTIDRLKASKRHDVLEDVSELLRSNDYQTVTVKTRAGRIVSVVQETSQLI